MKNLKNLKGARQLSKKEQRSVKGGGCGAPGVTCGHMSACFDGVCVPFIYVDIVS